MTSVTCDARTVARHRHRLLVTGMLAVVGLAMSPVPGTAQSSAGDRPTLGLVLSGGSAKGLAHVGVLRVLESRGIYADIVTGTSMGSVVGGLYATGLSVDSIASAARDIDWGALMTDAVDRGARSLDQRFDDQRTLLSLPLDGTKVGLPSGIVAGNRVLRELELLTWRYSTVRDFTTLPRAYTAIGTDLETGEAVPLQSGVLARAIRASMAIPGAVEPIVIDGRLLTDGGVIRNLPAQDALDLGAEVLICVDVTAGLESQEELGSALDVILQSVFFRSVDVTRQQRELCDIVISPDTDNLSSMNFDAAEEWYERGAAAARAALDTVALPTGVAGRPTPSLPTPALASDSVRITTVRVERLDGPEAVRHLRRVLQVEEGGIATRVGLEASMRRLDATDLYVHTGYHLQVEGTDTVLIVQAELREDDRVGVGLRYDSRFDAALLFTGTLRNRLAFGSTTDLEVRLGKEVRIRSTWAAGRGVVSRLAWGATAEWVRAPISVFSDPSTRIAEVEVDVLGGRATTAWELDLGTRIGVEAGAQRTWARTSTFITNVRSDTRAVFGGLHADTDLVDQRELPTRGVRARARADWGRTSGDETGWWAQQIAEGEAFLPLSSRLVARIGGYLGHASGSLPTNRTFAVGGVQRSSVFEATQPLLAGLPTQALEGDAVSIARMWLRWKVAGPLHLSVGAEGGSVSDDLVDREAWEWGWGAAATVSSVVGPVRLDVHGGRGDVRWSLALGHRF